MNWMDLMVSCPEAALVIREHLKGCVPDDPEDDPECARSCDPELFSFEVRGGIIKCVQPDDEERGVPPLWFVPEGRVASWPEAHCTGDPDEEEDEAIADAGFDYDWREWVDR